MRAQAIVNSTEGYCYARIYVCLLFSLSDIPAGANHHAWRLTTMAFEEILESSVPFDVDVDDYDEEAVFSVPH
jgi:hypothetical protein